MQQDIDVLEAHNTLEITELPQGNKDIGSKWVYKVKLKLDGTIERFKARLVAKGYNQIVGIDFNESFSPFAKVVTVWIILAIVASFSWPLH